MYARTNPGAARLTARRKRILAIVGAGVILSWAAWGSGEPWRPTRTRAPAHGCVNVTLPSSTGGATLHYCGAQARSFCRAAFRSQDQISLRARPQCVLAGLAADPRYSSITIVTGPSLTRDT